MFEKLYDLNTIRTSEFEIQDDGFDVITGEQFRVFVPNESNEAQPIQEGKLILSAIELPYALGRYCWTNFSEYPNEQLHLHDWVTALHEPHNSNERWNVIESAAGTGGKVARFTEVHGAIDKEMVLWDCTRGFKNGEVLAKIRFGSHSGWHTSCVGRMTEHGGYAMVVGGGLFRLSRINENMEGTLVGSISMSTPHNTWYWVRTSFEDSLVRTKVWIATQSEPGNWNITFDDSDPHLSGKAGLINSFGTPGNLSSFRECDIFSIARNGIAPLENPF